MKLFQIEEPDGSPADPEAPGVAVGIDVTGPQAVVAIAVGGNAVALADHDGFQLDLAVPPATAAHLDWQSLLEGARLRAERALTRPVTHAVIVANGAVSDPVQSAAAAAELILLRIMTPDQIAGDQPRVLAAAVLAEDMAPRIAPE